MDLSIKNVPEDVVARLRHRAKANHRSLQGELLTIVENAAPPEDLTLQQIYDRAKARGFTTPPDSVEIIRVDRDFR